MERCRIFGRTLVVSEWAIVLAVMIGGERFGNMPTASLVDLRLPFLRGMAANTISLLHSIIMLIVQ